MGLNDATRDRGQRERLGRRGRCGCPGRCGRREAGFTMAEVLIVVIISIALGAIAASAAFSITQSTRQTALDRQAESAFESISRNLTSVRVAGGVDDLRAGGVKVDGEFNGIAGAGNGSSRSYGKDYDDIVSILKNAVAAQEAGGGIAGAGGTGGGGGVGGDGSDVGDGAGGASTSKPKWQVQAEHIAQGIVDGSGKGSVGVTGSTFTIYRLSSVDTGEKAEAAKNVLLEAGVVSNEVLAGNWCVFYAVDSSYDYASILEVWYTTREYAGDLARQGEGNYAFAHIISDDGESVRVELRNDENRKALAGGYIGYYGVGSDAIDALPSAMLGTDPGLQCFMTITNAEKLVAHLFCYVPDDATYYSSGKLTTRMGYELEIVGETSGKSLNMNLGGSTGGRDDEFKVIPRSEGVPIFKSSGTVGSSGDLDMADTTNEEGRLYLIDDVVLDALDGNKSFANFKTFGLLPGENVKLKLSAKCKPNGNDISEPYVARAMPEAKRTVNSLFASLTAGEGAYTARVAYGRQLQNLDPQVSGLAIATGAAVGGDGKSLDVVQTQDIHFNGDGNTGDYSGFGANWADELEQWAAIYPAAPAADGASPRAFAPIVNGNISSFVAKSDSGAAIEDLVVDYGSDTLELGLGASGGGTGGDASAERAANAGLFGTFAGSKIRGISLIDPVVVGSAVAGEPGMSDTPGAGGAVENAGGLVGTATAGDLVIENCGLHMSALPDAARAADPRQYAGNVDWLVASKRAGGLVGHATGNVRMTGSYAATVVEATAADSVAGGLIGEVGGALDLADSYADCYVGAASVGGLVGKVDGTGTDAFTVSAPCFAAGFALGDIVDVAGAFVADGADPTGDGVADSYTLFRFGEPGGTHYAKTTSDNDIAEPENPAEDADGAGSEQAAPGNGYYLASVFEKDELKTWPYPLVGGLAHYGDWSVEDILPVLKVSNGEELTADMNLTRIEDLRGTDTVSLTMFGLTSDAVKKWYVPVSEFGKDKAKSIVLDRLYEDESGTGDDVRFKTQFTAGGASESFIPGENVVLWLTVTRGSGDASEPNEPTDADDSDETKESEETSVLVYPNRSAGENYIGCVTNTLFAYGSDGAEYVTVEEDSEDALKTIPQRDAGKPSSGPGMAGERFTAYVASGRHLQNLDAATFKFTGFTQSSDGAGAAAAVTDAVQVRDIEFGSGSAWATTYGSANFRSIDSTGSALNDTRIMTFDGQQHEIRDMVAEPTTTVASGLFGRFSGERIANVQMINARSGENASIAGALIGEVARASGIDGQNLVVSNCRSYLDGDSGSADEREAFITASLYAGGLIGSGPAAYGSLPPKEIDISDSFAASVVSATMKNQIARCGGLMGYSGSDSNAINVSNSYADCYLSGSVIGGLLGQCGETSTFENCYSAGFASDYESAAGLVPAKVASVKNCYSALYYGLPSDRSVDRGSDANTYAGEAATDRTVPVLSAHDNADFRDGVYGLVADVDGAATGGTMNGEFSGESTASFYTFKNVNDNSVVWSDDTGSLFSYVKGAYLADRLAGVAGGSGAGSGAGSGSSGSGGGAGSGSGSGGVFTMGGESHPYNFTSYFADPSPQLTAYPYPTIAGLPHYGDWLEEWSEDLSDFGLKVHLRAPVRDASGKIELDADGKVKKRELGVVWYRKDMSDFVTLVNPYYLAYLYTSAEKELPNELSGLDLSKLGEFLTVDEQKPEYPNNPDDANQLALFKRLTVAEGSVGAKSSSAIEMTSGDRAVEAGIDDGFGDVMRTVIPDASDWNGNHSVRRYFLAPANLDEGEFFAEGLTAGGEGLSSEDRALRLAQQTYRDDDESTVFFAGFGAPGVSAQRALEQKRSGFGSSIGRIGLDAYIESYGDKEGVSRKVSASGSSMEIVRTVGATLGRKKNVTYTGDWVAYLEWFPKVSLKTVDNPEAVLETAKAGADAGSGGSGALPDFTTEAKPVKQYVTDASGNYLDGTGKVVEAATDAATEDAALHYVNLGTATASASSDGSDVVDADGVGSTDGTGDTSASTSAIPVGGSYYASPDASARSLVRSQPSADSTKTFADRYAGFKCVSSTGVEIEGTDYVLQKSDSTAPFLGFCFTAPTGDNSNGASDGTGAGSDVVVADSDGNGSDGAAAPTIGQVYTSTGQVPRAVINGERFIDRDYTAYARYGNAVELVVEKPLTVGGAPLYELASADKVTYPGDTEQRPYQVKRFVRFDEDATAWVKVDPETLEDVVPRTTVATDDEIPASSKPPTGATLVTVEQIVGYGYYASSSSPLGSPIALDLGGGIEALFGEGSAAPDSYQFRTVYTSDGSAAPLSVHYLEQTEFPNDSGEYEYKLAEFAADRELLQYRNPATGRALAYATYTTSNPDTNTDFVAAQPAGI